LDVNNGSVFVNENLIEYRLGHGMQLTQGAHVFKRYPAPQVRKYLCGSASAVPLGKIEPT
jgi:hypothetical protein